MPTIGIELCDAALRAAVSTKAETRPLEVADRNGASEWPGFAYHEGTNYTFGRPAEDMWFVHPRRVTHNFWSKLAHDTASTLDVGGRPPSFSELAFFFLRDYMARLAASAGPIEKIVLAVPGAYLKDEATEEEKIGLLLGMASELKLPLAGVIDMACAALCDPSAPGFNPTLPIIVVDMHLEGTDLSLLVAEEKLERKHFLHLPNSGYAQLLKHLTATMGNRFLRHTSFDILADGRVEQTFYRQTKEFLESGADEQHYQLNTATRNYEMHAKDDQLAADVQSFTNTLAQGLRSFVDHTAHAPGLCTVALTARTAKLPGLSARLRTIGFVRQIRLPAGASAAGAARIGENRLAVPADLAEVPVATAVPLSDTRRTNTSAWEARLQKSRHSAPRPVPTHAILDGIGHDLGGSGRFVIGPATSQAQMALPVAFDGTDDCVVPLLRENGHVWFIDPTPAGGPAGAPPPRVVIESGDRLTIRSGPAAAEIIFAHCLAANGSRA